MSADIICVLFFFFSLTCTCIHMNRILFPFVQPNGSFLVAYSWDQWPPALGTTASSLPNQGTSMAFWQQAGSGWSLALASFASKLDDFGCCFKKQTNKKTRSWPLVCLAISLLLFLHFGHVSLCTYIAVNMHTQTCNAYPECEFQRTWWRKMTTALLCFYSKSWVNRVLTQAIGPWVLNPSLISWHWALATMLQTRHYTVSLLQHFFWSWALVLCI